VTIPPLRSTTSFAMLVALLLGSAASSALAAPLPDAPVQEASQDPQAQEGDVVIFSRPLPGFQKILSPLSQQGLVGDTFGWYPYCSAESTPVSMCYFFPDTGGPPGVATEEDCMKKQDALHSTYLASQSLRYTGSTTFFQKPGETVRMPACRPETIGRGFSCFGEYASCYTVETETLVLYGADTSECMTPNAGDFTRVLATFGLTEPGPSFDPATACKASPARYYGRTETCSWVDGPDGNRTIRPDESCFSVDTRTSAATEVTVNFCRNYVPALAESPSIDALLKQAGMVKGSLPFSLNCGQNDEGKLTSKIVSDTPGTTSDGRLTRTIDYEFACMQSGAPAPSTACAGAFSAWTTASAKFASENGLELTVQPGVLKKREIYTER